MPLNPVESPDAATLSVDCLIGRGLVDIDASAAPNQWIFSFGAPCALLAETLWRVVGPARIVAVSEDHQQRFGQPAALDLREEVLSLLRDARVRAASYDSVTGDLTLAFTNDLRLEVIVSSRGYESWSLVKPDRTQLIAAGGGRIVAYRDAAV